MKDKLTIERLCSSAEAFCQTESGIFYPEIYGTTDDKAIGTFVEHKFQNYLAERYDFTSGSSAYGLDLPSVKTNIKVTSLVQPQSSCPYKDSRQKIYGLGYNLIVLVYQKEDDETLRKGVLRYVSCVFIESRRTADFQLTRSIIETLNNDGNVDDIFSLLSDRQVPGNEITLTKLAEEIVIRPPMQGYLTISNALQWRLQYKRVVHLPEQIDGPTTHAIWLDSTTKMRLKMLYRFLNPRP